MSLVRIEVSELYPVYYHVPAFDSQAGFEVELPDELIARWDAASDAHHAVLDEITAIIDGKR